MTSIPARPRQLAALMQQLQRASLPALATDTETALALAGNVELRRLQSLAEREPGLALQILRQVNARLRPGQDLRGLQQGVHLLGSAGVQRLLRSTRAVRLDLSVPGHRLCLQAMASSRLAWLYLAHWLRSSLASDEDARLSQLSLLGVARWKLPLVQPQLAAAIETRVQAGERRARVERALIGADLDTINLWHLQDLGFPEVEGLVGQLRLPPHTVAQAARCVRTTESVSELPADLKRALRERLLGCSLAYALALETQVDWYSTRTLSLLRTVSAWLGRPLAETLRGVQRQALFASGEAVFTQGLRAPAVGLLWPPLPARSLGREALPSAVSSHADVDANESPRASFKTDASALRSAVADDPLAAFQQRCDAGHPDLRSLMTDSVRLFATLGLPRSALFLRQAGSERLACYFSHGFAAGEAGRDVSVEIGDRNLVKLLLAQPGVAFRIAPAQLAGLGNKLPPELSAWPPPSGLLLAAVPFKDRVVGFWWADAGAQGQETDSESFSRFRRAATAFGPAFTRLLNARSKNTSQPIGA